MANKLEQTFKKGLESIEDLNSLLNPSLSPVVSRIYHHLNQLHLQAQSQDVLTGDLSGIQSFFEGWLDDSISNFHLNSGVEHLACIKPQAELKFQTWNKILDLLPGMLEIGKHFNFKKTLVLNLEAPKITLTGFVAEEEDLLAIREMAYRITKSFLGKKALITFEALESDERGFYKLRLACDYGHVEDKVWTVSQDETGHSLIGFSNVFEKYKVSKGEASRLGQHHVIEIASDFNVIRHKSIPEKFTRDSFDGEIVHFSFLFRPLSLIIFNKGNIRDAGDFHLDRTTGCEIDAGKQDVCSPFLKQYRFIDFFSMVSK